MKLFKMKRIMTALLAMVLIFATVMAASACGKKSTTDTADTTKEDATKATEEEGGTAPVDDGDVSSIEFVRMMGNGINLGNTLEAYGHSKGTTMATSIYETGWGQPVTTEDMIKGMKEAGFDTIRIPVAWTNMMDFESGNYTIGTAYLDRVEEIAKWAVDADMYVIINDHWDGGWWGMFGSSTEETRTEAMTMYTEMWTQICERFKDYSDKVIFESGNEEIGDRLNDTDICKDSGSLSEDECFETANVINQKFVDVVRASGGNNENRFLLIAGYNTNIIKTCDDRFKMPDDTATDKLLVSVHFYDPWNFCSEDQKEQPQWGTKSEFKSMNASLELMTKFTDAGIGVVIGEYGAMPLADGSFKNDMNAYHQNILDLCDLYDYCPVLWDRGDFYSKTDCKLADDDMAALYASRTYAKESEKSVDDIKAAAQASIDAAIEAAPDKFESNEDPVDPSTLEPAKAWIMWNGGGLSYSVGDTYNPEGDCTEGLVATDADIDGEGTYTVSLDFTGTEAQKSYGITFSALAIRNGEYLYPGYYIDIKEILINGEAIELAGKPYTTADDGKCTRVNIINEWVSSLPDEARVSDGNLDDCSWVIINKADFSQVETIEITFDYVAPAE